VGLRVCLVYTISMQALLCVQVVSVGYFHNRACGGGTKTLYRLQPARPTHCVTISVPVSSLPLSSKVFDRLVHTYMLLAVSKYSKPFTLPVAIHSGHQPLRDLSRSLHPRNLNSWSHSTTLQDYNATRRSVLNRPPLHATQPKVDA
jgi:hypothetical protein